MYHVGDGSLLFILRLSNFYALFLALVLTVMLIYF